MDGRAQTKILRANWAQGIGFLGIETVPIVAIPISVFRISTYSDAKAR